MAPVPHFRIARLRDRRTPRHEAGSVLLILLFMMATMVIAMAIAAPRIAQQIKRDREIEMIHRGEQYARAIKRYYKKTGRFPTRIEELENTNNVRFLRKRYKDPMTPDGKWRLVRYGEVQLGQSGTGGATTGGSAGQTGGGNTPQGSGTSTSQGSTNAGTTADTGSSSGSSFGSSPSTSGFGSSFGASGTGSLFGSGSTSGTAGTAGTSGTTQPTSLFGSGTGGGNQVFGGGPIVGVASLSEKQGIHEFNNKKQYNQWLFVYDPTQDPTGARLIKGPYNPKAFVGTANQVGQPIGPGGIGNPAGNQGGFGNPMSSPGGFGQPQQPQPNPMTPQSPTAPNR